MVKNLPASAGDVGDRGSIPGSGKSPRRRQQPTPEFLPRESCGQRSPAGHSPRCREELDVTENARCNMRH